jgi:hypothetical protein
MATRGKRADCHGKHLGLAALAMVAASGLGDPAQAVQLQNGFAGAYAPANWSLATGLGNGSVDTSGAPASIELSGSNDGSGFEIATDYTTKAIASGLVTFDWSFFNGDPNFDEFGFLRNNAFTPLGTVPSQGVSQQFNISAGDIFGFRVLTTDDFQSPGIASISNFSAPVPGPLPILGLGAAFGWSRRLRRRSGLGSGCDTPDRG